MAKISYKQDNIDLLMQKLNKVSTVLGSMNSGAFSSISDNETLGGGINKLQKNMSAIGDRASGCASVINKGRDSFSQSEIYLESAIDQIELPTDLKNVYSPTEETLQDTSLNKNDGTGVNANDNTKEEKLADITGEEENLGNITKAEVKDEQLTDMYDKDKERIGSINNGVATNEQEMKDIKETEANSLGELKQGDTEEEAMADNYGTDKDNINDINKAGGDEEQAYKDKLAGAQGASMSDVSGGKVGTSSYQDNTDGSSSSMGEAASSSSTHESTYKDNTKGTSSNLGEAASSNATSEASYQDGTEGTIANMGEAATLNATEEENYQDDTDDNDKSQVNDISTEATGEVEVKEKDFETNKNELNDPNKEDVVVPILTEEINVVKAKEDKKDEEVVQVTI